MNDYVKALLLVSLMFFLVILLIYIFFGPILALDCNRFHAITGLSVTFDIPSLTCYANYDGIWLPKDQVFQLIGK